MKLKSYFSSDCHRNALSFSFIAFIFITSQSHPLRVGFLLSPLLITCNLTSAFSKPLQCFLLNKKNDGVSAGYVGDDEATAATLDQEGWLKTGDLCYFDSDGFLFIVDRLKELIKYKAYQVIELL